MISLAFFFAISIVVAIVFVLWPIRLDKTKVFSTCLDTRSLKNKLIAQEVNLGWIEAQNQNALFADQSISSNLSGAGYDKAQIAKNNFFNGNKLPYLLVAFLPILSVYFYSQWGSYSALNASRIHQHQQLELENILKQYPTAEALIQQMEMIMQNQPNSAKGWFLLGRLYMGHGDYGKAVKAFSKANKLNPNEMNIQQQLAEAYFYHDKQSLNSTAKKLLLDVLAKEPQNLLSHHLLALDAYHKGQYQNAIRLWEEILPTVPAQSSTANMLLQLIAKAQKHQEKQK